MGKLALKFKIPIIVESNDKSFYAHSPSLPGLLIDDDTVNDALQNAKNNAIALLQTMIKDGDTLPLIAFVKTATMGKIYNKVISVSFKSERLVFRVPIVVGKDDPGYYSYSPALKGLHMPGDTEQEALDNAKETAKDFLEIMIEDGIPIPLGRLVKVQKKSHNTEIEVKL